MFYNGKLTGILTKTRKTYRFVYGNTYLSTAGSRPVSITMPLKKQVYESNCLFSIFINLLSEDSNRRIQCRVLKIDENDYFSLLIATAMHETIGPITVKSLPNALY